MASVPTQFSVTTANVRPIANPALPNDAPKIIDSEEKPAVDVPVSRTAEQKAFTSTPNAKTAESKADVGTPSTKGAEAKESVPAPTALTANAKTLTAPPFPLNHARVLHGNELFFYSFITSSEGVPLNAITPNTWQRWEFDSTASDSAILIEIPTVVDMDTICIGAHNIGDISGTVSLTYSTDGVAFFDWAPDFAVTTNAAIMSHLSSTLSVKAIRIQINSGATDSGYIGYISAGEALQMQRPFFNGHTPFTDADRTEYYANRTESGERIGRLIRRKGFETSFSWNNLDDTWYRQYIPDFKADAKINPIFIAWNLLEYPLDVAFGDVVEDISASMQNGVGTKRAGLSFSVAGVG